MDSRQSILIVDDEEDILELLTYNFEKEGYEVFQASDGEEAIQTAKQYLPDLILLDIMMPKMNGLQTCAELRMIPELERTLIIFLTARSESHSEEAGYEAGADDFIFKPIKPKELKEKVKRLLGRE